MSMSQFITKRRLHEPHRRTEFWATQTPAARLEAVEMIRRRTFEPDDPQQAFPRVYRVTRKAPR